jgi:DNA adenine methylase
MSLFPYLGEKTKFSNFIIPNIPSNISTYVEPFGGSFGIFFSLNLDDYDNVNFIYNDINYLNYNLFNQLKSNNNFIDFLTNTKVDEVFYKNSLSVINNEKDDILLALNWLIVLTCSSPYEIGKESWRGSSKFEMFKIRYNNYKSKIDRINYIHNIDYKEIIDKYDSPDTLFYLDPPYKDKEKYYINHTFNTDSHLELSKILNNIQGKFILSYYYFDGLRELYPGFRFESKKTIMGTEWIIMNF